MLTPGTHTARIVKCWLAMDPKQQLYVNLQLEFPPEDGILYTRIYITEKAAGIARAKLRKCGFDLDKQSLGDIEHDENFLAGREVVVDVVENGKYLNANIPTERPKVGKAACSMGDELLRKAKKGNGDDGGDPEEVPPAVSHLPKGKRDQLQKQAEEEEVPF